ncbi:hypothetical protein SCLCIDRAFT_48076, partial [Scleroderma citrinum Foug A]
VFCPACPQLEINLPGDWKDLYNEDTVTLHYVVDGNFTAQHMKMMRPECDIALADGLGYMVEDGPYQNHISSAQRPKIHLKQKSSCQNHRTVNEANVNRSNLQATGIGATACARHGCFVLHCVVDFNKGEQQKSIDYSICQALSYNSTGITKALIIYDVACQWYVKFCRRVEACPALQIPDDMDIIPAVGKFHLNAHNLDCF